MIRVAFLIDNEHYIGGINYIKNLLSAINKIEHHSLELYVFCGNKVSKQFIQQFQPLAKIVQSSYFDAQSFHWYRYTKLFEYTGLLYPINRLLQHYKIDVVSHSNVYGNLPYKTLNWLPDFQFLRLPYMFSKRDLGKENKRFRKAIQLSDRIIVSSFDAQNDLASYTPQSIAKSKVLQFVAQPHPQVYSFSKKEGLEIERTYQVGTKYFYIPNQFWKHKNHAIAFEAVNLLKNDGLDVQLICSGVLKDYRRNHKHYAIELENYIKLNHLDKNIHLVGVIPYAHVTYFIRNCIAIINPSLFEGWHTAVEEAKSIGKQVILSNINVHKEQNPPKANYFNPMDANELAKIMRFHWETCEGGPDLQLEAEAKAKLESRILHFGETYINYVMDL
jgi:glycosyltransferase involved in cell wall biosynthesis